MAATSLLASLSTTDQMRAAALENFMYLVNGNNPNRKFVPAASTVLYRMGISASHAVKPTLADATTAGSITAGVHWGYLVGVYSSGRTVSAISPKNSWSAGGALKLRLTAAVTFSDTQVDTRHWYMTTAGAGSGGNFYLAWVFNNNSSKNPSLIDISDAALTGKAVIDITQGMDGGYPPRAKYIITKWNRVWLLNITETSGVNSGTSYPSRVAYSLQLGQTDASYNEAEMFSAANRLRINEDDGDYITAVAKLTNSIVVFKRNAIYEISQETSGNPNLPSNQYHLVRFIPSDGVGCIAESSQHGVVVVTTAGEEAAAQGTTPSHLLGFHTVYFPWYNGIYRLGENDLIEKISNDIQDTWDNLNVARLKNIEMGYDPVNRYLLVSCSRSGKTINDLVLRYDLVRKRWLKDEISVSAFSQVEESGGNARLYFGDYWGFVNRIYDTNYDGVSVGTLVGQANSGSSKTFTFTTGGFTTAGQGLKGIPMWISTASGHEKRYIQSNSKTVIQVYTGGGFSAFSSSPGSGNGFRIGYIDGRFKTARHAHGSFDTQKRWIYANTYFDRQAGGSLDVYRFLDGSTTTARQKRIPMYNRVMEYVPLYPDEAFPPTKNKSFFIELVYQNAEVNQPFKIRYISFDAEVTDEVQE